MKTKRLRMLACLGVLILGVSLIIGCGGGGAQAPTTAHFAAGGVSFDYPSTWDKLKSDDPARIAYFSEVETGTIVQVITEALPSGFTLKTYHDNLVIQLMVGEPIWGKPLTVAGVKAYETGFNAKIDNQDLRMRAVSLEKDGTVYDIVLSTEPDSFNEVNDDFDTVIDSFQVQ
jgi:sortase A